jgi:hypothetical protein
MILFNIFDSALQTPFKFKPTDISLNMCKEILKYNNLPVTDRNFNDYVLAIKTLTKPAIACAGFILMMMIMKYNNPPINITIDSPVFKEYLNIYDTIPNNTLTLLNLPILDDTVKQNILRDIENTNLNM